MRKTLKLTLIGAGLALSLPLAAQAQDWHRHPAYLHAMSDLRSAYWLVQHHESMDPLANIEERKALGDIRGAYQELKDAAIMDDKNIDDQPPADMTFGDHRARLHRALDLLRDAHSEVARAEEDPAARGLRDRAIKHIDKAEHATDDAIHAWRF